MAGFYSAVDSAYRTFIRRLMGIRRFDLNCHWHYASSGCSVSPHCDAKRKHGSHLFYFNTSRDWDTAWGGQTRVLDDGGCLAHAANPECEDLGCVAASQAVGNYSLLFKRGEHSWHGVRRAPLSGRPHAQGLHRRGQPLDARPADATPLR